MLKSVDGLVLAYSDALVRWVSGVAHNASLILGTFLIISAGMLFFVFDHIAIDTKTTDMLSPELPFRQDATALDRAFPQFSDNILVVLDGPNPDSLDDAARELVTKLREQPTIFSDVFYPRDLPFFRKNQLLYLDRPELSDLIDRLAASQPFIGTLARDPSISALFDLIGLSLEELENNDGADKASLKVAITEISAVIEAQNAGDPKRLSWQNLMSGRRSDDTTTRRLILVQPFLNFASFEPGGTAISTLRALEKSIGLEENFGVRMRLTGSVPLAEEELESVAEGMGLAALLSGLLVLGLLGWALKSVRLVAATLLTLICGLIWTAAFALAAVGALNLISVAFAVLFIGLSVDFGIHFTLRYKEAYGQGVSSTAALQSAAGSVGNAITLTAVAAAIGFFAFLPTDYRGLAELGLIAGGGMFIALFLNLTLLPAAITLLPPKRPPPAPPRSRRPLLAQTRRYPVLAACIAVVVAGGSAVLIPGAKFDFDPLNLKDSTTESASTIFELLDDDRATPYSITILTENLGAADKIAKTLAALDSVRGTLTLSDFLPKDQEPKLELIENASFLLSSLFTEPSSPPSSGAPKALKKIQNRLKTYLAQETPNDEGLSREARRLLTAVTAFAKKFRGDEKAWDQLRDNLLSTLPGRLSMLKEGLDAAATVDRNDLPKSILARQIATDGRARLEVYPRGNMRNSEELRRFVSAVREVAPRATGAPVVILEAGNTVITAFLQAALTAALGIAILLIVLLRSARDVILVFAPLLLAGLLTVAASVLADLSFNFANVIVLPLLFGLGVASAVHLLARERREDGGIDVLETSTPRAVIFSALTTIGSFATIALSAHPGTSSMGVLLTIAIISTMASTLFVLPALMTLWPTTRTS